MAQYGFNQDPSMYADQGLSLGPYVPAPPMQGNPQMLPSSNTRYLPGPPAGRLGAGMGGTASPYRPSALGGLRGMGALQPAGQMGALGGPVSQRAAFANERSQGLGVRPGAVPQMNAVQAARAAQGPQGPGPDLNDPKNAALAGYR